MCCRARGACVQLLFHMCWNPAYIVLILFSAFSTYLCGRALAVLCAGRRNRGRRRRPWPFRWRQIWEFCFSSNIIIFLRKCERSAGCGGFPAVPLLGVLLPVGISFYVSGDQLHCGRIPGQRNPPSSAFCGICCLSPFRSWWPGPLNAAAISFPNCSCLPVFPTSGPKAAQQC